MILSNEVALKIANSVSNDIFSNVEFLYDGASSRAWKVTSQKQSLIVRMSRPDVDRPITYQSELEIFKQLELIKVPVPKALATYKDMSIDEVEIPWAVTQLIEGCAVESKNLSPEVAVNLGQALAKVHSLPVSNFGRLEEKENEFCGKQLTPREGVLARYCYGLVWPFDNSSLVNNAAYIRFSNLENRILQHEGYIRQIAKDKNVALIHSDLHGKHIFEESNRLSGIIDFGAAFIGVVEWEFGRLGFEFGWTSVKEILDAYLSRSDRTILSQRIYLVALVFALYKIDRYVREGSPEYKISKGLNILEQTLNQLESKSEKLF